MGALTEDEALRKSLRKVDLFLPKPFSPITLLKSVQQVITGKVAA